MIIKSYEIFVLSFDDFSNVNIDLITSSINNTYYLRMFLVYSFGDVRRDNILNSIEKIDDFFQDGISFDFVDISIDNNANLVYLSESWYDYKDKPTTDEIEKLLEDANFIELCKMGFLDYAVMTRDNFIHLLLTWNKILDQLPSFALLYQDDKDWYNIVPFDSKEAMDQFIVDHVK
ncbi:hypothetical protein KBC04_02730 [Candidatus Babeliales bacterium]|nr:hypothetical protein [Candidatus Babeliales bacterium]MBP9844032.1 hypothetical protein [Candidatus Babeliales bacterium]